MKAITVEPKHAGSAKLEEVPEPDVRDGSVLVVNRLIATRHVDDRQPPHREPNAAFDHASLAVWPAMRNPGVHALECRDIDAVDRLGFLGSCRFRCKIPRSDLLDSLGFPWILSSESRLFNGLRGVSREEFFSRVLLALRGVGTGA